MRAYFFILFLSPFLSVAQTQETQPVNGATDCPTFGKKNVSSKASLFQYMRTHKPQRTKDTREQQSIYRTSALPDLREAQETRDAAALKQQEKNNERALARAQRQRRDRPATTEEISSIETSAESNKPAATLQIAESKSSERTSPPKTKPVKEKTAYEVSLKNDSDKDLAQEKEESSSTETLAHTRDKKIKKAAFKSKMQHLFKRKSKPSSRKHAEKCPSF